MSQEDQEEKENSCPTNDFEAGVASGKCWGDGHYRCEECKHFRPEFKADHTLRDKLLFGQGAIRISTL